MSEWWTYRLSDLILFSPDVYYRTFALYHHRIWPAHLVVLLLAGLTAVLTIRGLRSSTRPRALLLLLAASWFWVGLAFHLGTYATISWAATGFAGAFILQGCILVWIGVRGPAVRLDPASLKRGWIAVTLIATAAGVAGLLAGRRWDQLEFIGLTPDPTAAATIVMLRLWQPSPRVALVIPVMWCLVGGLTLWGLHSFEAWWTWVSALGALVMPGLRPRRP